MMRTVAAAAVAAICFGCATGASVVRVDTSEEYDALWEASVGVVGSRFAISAAQKESGVIETDWLVGALSRTGLKSNAVSGEARSQDFLHTMRRRATVRVARGGEEPLGVEVELARLVREHADAVVGGTFSVGRTIEGDEEGPKSRWVGQGRDVELEAKMREEIARVFALKCRCGTH